MRQETAEPIQEYRHHFLFFQYVTRPLPRPGAPLPPLLRRAALERAADDGLYAIQCPAMPCLQASHANTMIDSDSDKHFEADFAEYTVGRHPRIFARAGAGRCDAREHTGTAHRRRRRRHVRFFFTISSPMLRLPMRVREKRRRYVQITSNTGHYAATAYHVQREGAACHARCHDDAISCLEIDIQHYELMPYYIYDDLICKML